MRKSALAALILAAAAGFAASPALVLPFDAYREQVWFHGSVNNKGPVWLLFDSAAGGSTISRELNERLGLQDHQFAIATAGGAGPEVLQVPVLRDITFSYRGLRLSPQRVPAIPHEGVDALFGRHIDGILGKDLLERYVVELDNAEHKMLLYEPAGYQYRGKGLVLPVRVGVDGPIFDAAVRVPPDRRLPCRLMIDTGAAMGLVFATPFSKHHGLVDAVRPLSERLVPVRGGGVGGPEDNTVGRIEALEIGPYRIPRPVALFADARGGSLARTDFDALIGMGLLHRFRVIFDYARQRIILEPSAELAEPMEGDMSGLALKAVGPGLERVVVATVHQDSPGSAADLRPGDRVVSIDGREPGTLWDVQRALKAGPGQTVRVGIERGNLRREVTLTLRRFV
jgi:hypothetical protein